MTIYDLINEAVDEEYLNSRNWRLITNKMVYAGHEKKFPVVKVEVDLGLSFKNVWKRLQNPVMSRWAVDNMYLLIHNKIPVRERLFRIGVRNDPYCEWCEGAQVSDVEHVFTTCVRTMMLWSWVRGKIVKWMGLGMVSNWELINLRFPSFGWLEHI